jgi:hypothetical protein
LTVAQSVSASYAPGVDFSKYRSYKWVSVRGEPVDPALDAQIKQSLEPILASKRLTKVDGTADLSVDYQVALSQAVKWEVYEDWTETGLAQRLPQRRQIVIDVGTLVLDMYDTAHKALVWTGSAKKTLSRDSTPEQRQKSLDKAAKKMLVNFPPPQ